MPFKTNRGNLADVGPIEDEIWWVLINEMGIKWTPDALRDLAFLQIGGVRGVPASVFGEGGTFVRRDYLPGQHVCSTNDIRIGLNRILADNGVPLRVVSVRLYDIYSPIRMCLMYSAEEAVAA